MHRSLLCGLALILFSQPCFAGARHFGYLYEAPTTPPGIFELENYATERFGESGFDQSDFRHELEFGITDRLQASIYFANWSYVRKAIMVACITTAHRWKRFTILATQQAIRLAFPFTRN